jgi:hypothetical protein
VTSHRLEVSVVVVGVQPADADWTHRNQELNRADHWGRGSARPLAAAPGDHIQQGQIVLRRRHSESCIGSEALIADEGLVIVRKEEATSRATRVPAKLVLNAFTTGVPAGRAAGPPRRR